MADQLPKATRRALLLDFDGVLVDSEPLNFETWNMTFREMYGRHLERDHRVMVGLSLRDILRLWTHAEDFPPLELTPDVERALLNRKTEHFFAQAGQRLRPTAGSVELIRHLRAAGWYVAIVSRSARLRLVRILDLIHMPALFDLVLGGEDAIHPRTDRKDYALACTLLRAAPADCVVVEDSVTGIEDACRAGVGSVMGMTTSLSAEVLKAGGANMAIETLATLVALHQQDRL